MAPQKSQALSQDTSELTSMETRLETRLQKRLQTRPETLLKTHREKLLGMSRDVPEMLFEKRLETRIKPRR